jgi:hypothetical protein
MNQHLEPWLLPYIRLLVLLLTLHFGYRAWTQWQLGKKQSARALVAIAATFAAILWIRIFFG